MFWRHCRSAFWLFCNETLPRNYRHHQVGICEKNIESHNYPTVRICKKWSWIIQLYKQEQQRVAHCPHWRFTFWSVCGVEIGEEGGNNKKLHFTQGQRCTYGLKVWSPWWFQFVWWLPIFLFQYFWWKTDEKNQRSWWSKTFYCIWLFFTFLLFLLYFPIALIVLSCTWWWALHSRRKENADLIEQLPY